MNGRVAAADGAFECSRCHHGTCAGRASASPVESDDDDRAEEECACTRDGGSWNRISGDIGRRLNDGERIVVAEEGVCSRDEEPEDAGLSGGDGCV